MCFRTPSSNRRPISAEKDSFIFIVGACMEQKNGTLCTVQGTDTLLLLGAIRSNINRPKHITDGSHLFPDGRQS